MRAAQEHRSRDDTETAVLDALVGRDEGMTVFELRSHVDVDIDELETALGELKDDDLIAADTSRDPTVITATEKAKPADPDEDDAESLVDRILDKLPF